MDILFYNLTQYRRFLSTFSLLLTRCMLCSYLIIIPYVISCTKYKCPHISAFIQTDMINFNHRYGKIMIRKITYWTLLNFITRFQTLYWYDHLKPSYEYYMKKGSILSIAISLKIFVYPCVFCLIALTHVPFIIFLFITILSLLSCNVVSIHYKFTKCLNKLGVCFSR